MSQLATLAAVGAAALLLWGAIRAGFAALRRGGQDAARAEAAEAELEIERRRSAVVAEQRTVEDAQERLDDGSF